MAGTSKRRNVAAVQEKEGISPVLVMLGRLVLVILAELLVFLLLPLISVFISRSLLSSRGKKFLRAARQIGQGNQSESRPIS